MSRNPQTILSPMSMPMSARWTAETKGSKRRWIMKMWPWSRTTSYELAKPRILPSPVLKKINKAIIRNGDLRNLNLLFDTS